MNRGALSILLGSVGFANLCAINLWHDCHRLQQPFVAYYHASASGDALIEGTILLVLVLAVLFFVISLAATRVKQPAVKRVLGSFFILSFLYPAFLANYVVASSNLGGTWLSVARLVMSPAYGCIVAAAALYLWGGTGRPLHALVSLNLMFSPLFLVLLGDTAFWAWQQRPGQDAFAEPPSASLPADTRTASARVLWLVFDEMDYTAAFPQRPQDLRLPELDRLRSESLSATDAYSPSYDTLASIPALVDGIPYSQVEIQGVSTLRLWDASGVSRLWEGPQTVFAAARKLGVASAVAGWFHPYCRIFGGILSACTFVPGTITPLMIREAYAAEVGAAPTTWYLLRSQLALLPLVPKSSAPALLVLAREQQLDRFRELHEKALSYAADPRLGLVLLHYPLPHPHGIYDRKAARFSTGDDATYVDNLALVDRVVGELRRALEMNGLWENTAIVLSSDHSLRKWDPSLIGWKPAPGSPASDGKERIPFLVRLPGQSRPRTWISKLNSIVTSPMILGILDGTISNIDQLENWLRTFDGSRAEASP